ncbi:PREDICTED: uncharacterized protein LOC107185366 [Dufourea novaeangliae]|nr:PREDICTED: uncharacterized protein LOC107185366 [Dufourea novaeangliae]
MRTIRLVVDLLDYRSRAYFLICVICVIVVPIVASSHGDKNDHASTYEKKTEEGSAKNLNKPKLSTHDESNEASNIKNNDIDSGAQSPKIKNGNSVALNRFLENVLKAKDDFKWIDRAVYELHHAKDLEK